MSNTARPDGQLILAVGASRSGKSVWVKEAIKNDARIVVFDPKGEYISQLGFTPCYDRKDLLAALMATKGAGRIAFRAIGKKEFQFFCEAAFNWNRQAVATIICEELANSTNSGKAEAYWGILISQGLAFGPKIIGTVQRGQEVDKSIFDNATFVHVTQHKTFKARTYLSDALEVDISEVPEKKLEFIQFVSGEGVVVSGSINFSGKASKIWPDGSPIFRGVANGNGKAKRLTIQKHAIFSGVTY